VSPAGRRIGGRWQGTRISGAVRVGDDPLGSWTAAKGSRCRVQPAWAEANKRVA